MMYRYFLLFLSSFEIYLVNFYYGYDAIFSSLR